MMSCLRRLFMCHTINEKGKRGLYGSQARKLIIIWILQKKLGFQFDEFLKLEADGGLVGVRWSLVGVQSVGPVRVWWGSCGGPVGDLERGSCTRVRIKGPTRVWWGSGEGLVRVWWGSDEGPVRVRWGSDEGPMRVWWLPDDSLMTFQWLMLWFWIPILKNEVFKQLCLARLSNV